ncbi:hypothetical protein SASPL_154029 [Salvia splendens]|uniref:O-fucosyltransferase family protein n=1 Tax=Salvia splendens TaxID=180675 RepID=A0A8X8VZS6_SALSN|nr:uncharacterized protein LOC121787086 [Salvia splendens]KAG6385201.1 hypothetical protein SASPL_154029 [Salvia splendens]
MLRRSSLRGGNSRPENLGQNFLAMIASLCFSVFVTGVVIFTTIAATYNSEEPFLRPVSEISDFLSSEAKSTDRTALIDTRDVESVVEEAGFTEFSDSGSCRVDDPINCRDLEVFHLLMTAAIDKFKDVHFNRFGKPVEGENGSSCHMAWRFRPKEGKATGYNKDYRSFRVLRFDNCTLSVVEIGGYHSGGNARKRKGRGKIEKVRSTAVGFGVKEESFRLGKYLVYVGGGERCKSMWHYMWSLVCMLGEAEFLNRTLVFDTSICLSKMHSLSGVDEEGKDFRFYFDLEHLKDASSVVDQAEFWPNWEKWSGLKLRLVEDFRVTPMRLAEAKESLIMRKFGAVEPDNFWFRVCEGEADGVMKRPWHKVSKARPLLDMASVIASRMGWDYDSVRVERREKVKNKEMWPNLDHDTHPEAVMAALRGRGVEDGRRVYVATDEGEAAFFDTMKGKYEVHSLEEHRDLWGSDSDWYYETTSMNNGSAVEFDGFMRQIVDGEVFLKGKKKIETFNDLTRDCRDGVNAC